MSWNPSAAGEEPKKPQVDALDENKQERSANVEVGLGAVGGFLEVEPRVFGDSEEEGDFFAGGEGVKYEAVKEQVGGRKELVRYGFVLQEKKTGFSAGDLVWGKVRSHPWWPGQIFDPEYASEMALKRQKKDQFLVAYFGDKSFAWVPESQLKPFQTNFSVMEKQSGLESFVDAVGNALEEVSRRVEMGMACQCLGNEVCVGLMGRVVENAGVRSRTRCADVDRSAFANDFRPESLMEYVFTFGKSVFNRFDQLELTVAAGQLMAYYRWKGQRVLPVLYSGDGLGENEAVVPLAKIEVPENGMSGSLMPAATSGKSGKRRGRPRKNQTPDDGNEQKTQPDQKGEVSDPQLSSPAPASSSRSGKRPRRRSRKNQSLEESDEQETLSYQRGEGLVTPAPVSSRQSGRRPRGRPRKNHNSEGSVEQKSPYKEMEEDADFSVEDEKLLSEAKSVARASNRKRRIGDSDSPEVLSSTRARSLRLGDRLSQVASQLKKSPMIQQSSVAMRGHEEGGNYLSELAEIAEVAAKEYTPSEMLSQLSLVAREPVDEYSFLPKIIGFFTKFMRWQSPGSPEEQELGKSTGRKRGRKKKGVNSELASSDPDYLQDSYWSDIMLQSSPERDSASVGQKRKQVSQNRRRKAKGKADGKSLASEKLLDDNLGEKVASDSEEKEETPTALILSFNAPDALPSMVDLTQVFSPYGPLKEEETDILRKTSRAKVVFKYFQDAERAFIEAGKSGAFGPALESSRLRPLHEASPNTSSQDKSDDDPADDSG